MTDERKFAILIAATILSARKLAELEDPDTPTPKKLSAVETAIRHAIYILGESAECYSDFRHVLEEFLQTPH